MRRVLVAGILVLLLAPAARANAIASIVVAKNGDVFFSDYVRDKIWRVDGVGRLSVALSHRHASHLVEDAEGGILGDQRSPRGDDFSIWRLEANGTADDVLRPARRGQATSYRGTVFTVDPDGNLLYVRDCQIVRLSRSGKLEPFAGRRCAETAWTDPATVYGHLHGSLAWGPGRLLYFSDGRTIRRVGIDGTVSTLAGRPTTLFADAQEGEERFDTLAGLAVDDRGNVYAADKRRRAILRFSRSGTPVIVARLGFFWSPTGLAVCGGDVFFLVNLRFSTPAFLAGIFGNPTLKKLSADGRTITVATVSGR